MAANNLLMQLQVEFHGFLNVGVNLTGECRLQADISGIPVFRAQSQDITALGTAMAAGQAEGIDLWDLHSEEREVVPTDAFLPTTADDGNYYMFFVFFVDQ